MDSLLVKIFATALTFSQVTVGPDQIKTEFDPVQDQHEVVTLLRAGCAHMRKAFDIEDINIDDLIATAMDDPEAVSGGLPQFRGLNLGDLHTAYKQFCKNETVANSPVNIADVIEFYNRAVANLPDHTRLRGMRLPGASVLLDGRGQKFAEVFEQDHRRVWVPLAEIPVHVRNAFIAAEDKRFPQHNGIDERALIRAFIGNLAGLTKLSSKLVRPPRVAESPIHLECRYHGTWTLPANRRHSSHHVVIGEVVGIHIRDDVIGADGKIDIAKVRPLARLGYMDYTSVTEVFTMAPQGTQAGQVGEAVPKRLVAAGVP